MAVPALPRVLAMSLLCTSLACAGERSLRNEAPAGPTLTVLTYNVNYGLAGDPEGLVALAESEAELVLLQETTQAWEQAIRADPRLAESWPHMRFHHCCGAGGLALLSRWPIETFEVVEPPLDPEAWFPAARAVIAGPDGPVQILDVHLRPPVATAEQGWLSAMSSTPAVREAEIQHFLPALDAELPTVVAGDFNEGDGGRALRVLDDAGFRDTLAELPRSRKTWRWGALKARLDHLLVDEHFEIVAVEVLDAGRSDHLPVRAVLARRSRQH